MNFLIYKKYGVPCQLYFCGKKIIFGLLFREMTSVSTSSVIPQTIIMLFVV